MKFYSVFDDFPVDTKKKLNEFGVELDVHPCGVPRPSGEELKRILELYDGIIIGTGQKITDDMFNKISSPRIIATASIGTDHIKVPDKNKEITTIINAPTSNIQSVSEYTFACILSCIKRLYEGHILYKNGLDNKKLSCKPRDLAGMNLSVIGAGNIAKSIMNLGVMFGMNVRYWTKHPSKHVDEIDSIIEYSDLDELVRHADIITVALPLNIDTANIISRELIDKMKKSTVFVSISRKETIDYMYILEKARSNPEFYVCLDIDVDDELVDIIPDSPNIIITPHIAGGTVESRIRMFNEVSDKIIELLCDE